MLAVGSNLQNFTPAETSPISTLTLPKTMTSLSFVNLPNLTYPNGGLTIAGFSNVKRLQISGCAKIDTFTLLSDTINGGAGIGEIYVPNIDITADTSILTALKSTGAKGIGSDLDDACDGLSGKWILSKLIDDSELKSLQDYFPLLTIHNAQYTMVVFDDTVDDPKNVTNLDNGMTGEKFTASGHVARIRKKLIPVKGKLNTSTGIWEGERISESNYQQLPDGSTFDFKDSLGDGFDVMMRCPNLWYKGINDFKNQKKYIAWSSLDSEPLSTASKIVRKTLKDIIYKTNSAVMINSVELGVSTLTSDGILSDTPNYNAYLIDVSGMKQVRYPGLNNSNIGGVFLNEDGVIIKTFNMAISSSMFYFVEGDYIFTDVPTGAKSFVFASSVNNNSLEAISVDSAEV